MKSFGYTYEDIAACAGKSMGALRVDITRERVDPEDLWSVSVYVVAEKLKGVRSAKRSSQT